MIIENNVYDSIRRYVKENHGITRIKFFEGRKTSRHYILDGGLFDGFYAVLVPLKIETI